MTHLQPQFETKIALRGLVVAQGKRVAFPKNRRFVLDILAAARNVPSFPVERTMQLAELSRMRRQAPVRISWAAIFLKSWGRVSCEFDELRQLYISSPIRHLYQSSNSTAAVSVNRTDESGQDFLIFPRIHAPENQTLVEIQHQLDLAKSDDPRRVFKDGYEMARIPQPLRWFVWQILMRYWGRKKAKKIGTFSISTLAGAGAMNRNHPLITTTSLAYSPITEDGGCLVTVLCDHRVIDGLRAANATERLEEVLQNEIVFELDSLMCHDSASAA